MRVARGRDMLLRKSALSGLAALAVHLYIVNERKNGA